MKNIAVDSVTTNWFFSAEYGDEFSVYYIGKKMLNGKAVTQIEYHQPCGDGDRHYADVFFDDGTCIRAFNINEVKFSKEATP